MSAVRMYSAEVGGLMIAELDGQMYVGEKEEWCRLADPAAGAYQVVRDSTLIRRLSARYAESRMRDLHADLQRVVARRRAAEGAS